MGDSLPSYDVFLSYHWQDRAAVEPIARALSERSLRVFLDRWYLTPGLSWVDKLEKTIASCRSAAIFVGPHGLGRWQQRERDLALDRQARDSTFPVIPVLLPDAEAALDFLSLNTWVDLRGRLAGPEQLDVLAKAVRGEAPGPDLLDAFRQTRAEICPYRGLRPFREEDARFFRGREAFTDTVDKAIERQSLVAVVGASGCGKSSVVQAGLIPHLRRRTAANSVYEVVTMVPGDRPLLRLAAALVPMLEPDLDEIQQLAKAGELAGFLQGGAVALPDVMDRVLAKQPGTDRLLLVVDQWEELYTLCSDDSARQRFIAEVLSARQQARLSIVLTLRGDFYGHALGDRALADRLQDGVVNIGPMLRDELRRAIEQPAGDVGLSFEDGLVDRILDDVGDEPGNLPLLEFVLEMLWQRRSGGEMHHAAYEQIGRVQGAIAQRANEIYERLAPAEQEAARRMLIRLVRPGEGTEDTRRRSVLSDLDSGARSVVQRMAAGRLLVTGRDPALGKEVVEVSHEALIQRWGLLRQWINEDREFLRTRERVAVAAAHWQANKRDSSLLLSPGRPLAEGQDLLSRRRGDLDDPLIEYIEASIAAEKARIYAQREAETRRNRRNLTIALVMSVLAAGAVGFGWYARLQQLEAQRQRREAEAGRLAAQADLARNESAVLLERSALLAIESTRLAPSLENESALRAALGLLAKPVFEIPHDDSVVALVFSPKGRYLATGSGDARVFATASGKELSRLAFGYQVHAVSFSPDERYLAAGGGDGTARVFEVANGKQCWRVAVKEYDPRIAGEVGTAVDDVSFSPDGRYVASASGHTARVFEALSGTEVSRLTFEQGVNVVSFSPDGRYVAAGGVDGTARVFEATNGREVSRLTFGGVVRSVAFSPVGRYVAAGSDDDSARVFEALSGKEVSRLTFQDRVDAVAFSPDGRYVAAGSADNTARVFETASGKELSRLSFQDRVGAVAFSPNGRYVAAGSADGTARAFDAASGKEVSRLIFQAPVGAVAFSPDGRYVAAGSEDQTLRVFEPVAGGTSRLTVHGLVEGVAFSPDWRYVAVGTANGSAQVFRAADGIEVSRLKSQANAVAFSPDGHQLAAGSDDGTLSVFDPLNGNEVSRFTLKDPQEEGRFPVLAVAFSPDSRYVAAGRWDGTARVFQAVNGREVSRLDVQDPQAEERIAVGAVAFSPDSRYVAVGVMDGTARVFEALSGKEVSRLRFQDRVGAVTFSADGNYVAAGSLDGTARVFGAFNGKEISRLNFQAGLNFQARVGAVAFSPDGRQMAAGSEDHTARLLDVIGGKEVSRLSLEGSVEAVAFSRDGRDLASATAGMREIIVARDPLHDQDLIDEACARLTRNLTEEEWRRFVPREKYRKTCTNLPSGGNGRLSIPIR